MGYTYGIKRGLYRSHPLYNTYYNMITRCSNKNRWNYKFYGGKGIVVCDRWKGQNGFAFFVEDMGDRPNGYQLDRINNEGNYEPTNCRWVNKYVQMGNTSTNNPDVGVGWHKQRNKWRARIKIKGKEISLGLFRSYNEALFARTEAFKKYAIS